MGIYNEEMLGPGDLITMLPGRPSSNSQLSFHPAELEEDFSNSTGLAYQFVYLVHLVYSVRYNNLSHSILLKRP